MIIMIIYGYKSIGGIDRDRVIVIGGVKTGEVRCRSLNIHGSVRAEYIICSKVILHGTGYIRSMNIGSGLIMSTSRIIYIDDLVAGEIFIHGGNRPVIVSRLKSSRAVITRSIIDDAYIDNELILGVGAHIRKIRGTPRIVFLDPYVRIEEFREEPKEIIYRY